MALSKITEQDRDTLKQKSAQSLPDVPSLQNWTPKQFKNAITKVLFDNKESFYAYHNKLVDEIVKDYLTKEDEKVYRFDKIFTSYADFVKSCNEVTILEPKVFYGTYSVGSSGAYDLVGIRRTSSKSVLILSGSGEFVYTDGTNIMPLSVEGGLTVNGQVKISEPTEVNSAATKNYVDAAKNNLATNIVTTKKELQTDISNAKNELGNYIDDEINNMNNSHVGMVQQLRQDVELNINNKTSQDNLKNTIGNASLNQSGLFSKEDYVKFNNVVELMKVNSDNFVNTLTEILNVFEDYPAGTNLIERLGTKVNNTDFNSYKNEIDNRFENVNIKYSNSNPIPTDIGGLKAGVTFDNVTVKEMFDLLLYPYVKFKVNLLSLSNTTYNNRFDGEKTFSQITVGTTKGTSPIVKIELYLGVGGEKVGELYNENGIETNQYGSVVVPLNKTVVLNINNNGKSFYVVGTDKTGETATATSTSFTFYYPYYYGVVAKDSTITSSLVTGLTESVVAKGNKTYTYNMTQQKAVIAYPASYGNLTKILDANSFDVTETFVKHTLTIHGVSYYVYVLDTPATSNMKYTFSY